MRVSEVNESQNVKLAEERSYELLQKKGEQSGKISFLNNEEKDQPHLLDREPLEESIEELNVTVNALHKDLKFKVHDKSGRMMVEVINVDENEVIKEIPPAELLDMLGRIKDMVGLIIDEKI